MVERAVVVRTPARWWLGVVALLAALALVAAGCNGDAESPVDDDDDVVVDEGPDGDDDDDAVDADVDRDATLRTSHFVVPPNLDPNQEPYLSARMNNRLLYDSLLMTDFTGTEVIPGIAESWEFDDEGTTLTLRLREDATFTDETPITAEAVQFSLDRARAEDSSNAAALADIASVEVVDPMTVNVHLARPTTLILHALAQSAGMVMNPGVIDEDTDLSGGPPPGGGSGIYEVLEFIPGERLVVERVERPYWDEEAGRIRRIEWQPVPESTTVMNALLTGELDLGFMLGAPIEDMTALADRDPTVDVEQWLGRSGHGFWISPARIPDVRVRQAIAMSVDWESIAESVLPPGAVFARNQYLLEGDPGYLPDGGPLSYDPDRARELLEEAGVTDPTFELTVSTDRNQLVAEAIAAEAEAVGITLQVRRDEPGVFVEILDGRLDLYLNQTTQEGVLPVFIERAILRDYDRMLSDEEKSELTERIGRMTDPTASDAEREEALTEGHIWLAEQMWRVSIGFNPITWAVKDNVHGLDRMQEGITGLADLRWLYMTR